MLLPPCSKFVLNQDGCRPARINDLNTKASLPHENWRKGTLKVRRPSNTNSRFLVARGHEIFLGSGHDETTDSPVHSRLPPTFRFFLIGLNGNQLFNMVAGGDGVVVVTLEDEFGCAALWDSRCGLWPCSFLFVLRPMEPFILPNTAIQSSKIFHSLPSA